MHQLKFSSFSKLQTKRLSLRFPNSNDAQSIFRLRTNATINKYITRPVPKDIADVEGFICKISENIENNKNLYWLIICNKTQDVMGSIGYHSFSNDLKYGEIGYELHPNFHKKGYMTEAFEKAITFGFQKLKLETIEAFTHKNNDASKSLLTKHNFILQPERIDEGFENNSIFQLKFSES